jgi:transitional endoplasmic reticulum ATPase
MSDYGCEKRRRLSSAAINRTRQTVGADMYRRSNYSKAEVSDFAGLKKLDYILRSLEYFGYIPSETILSLALKFLCLQEKKRILNTAIVLVNNLKSMTKDAGNNLKTEYSIEDALERLNKNEAVKPCLFDHILEGLFKVRKKVGKEPLENTLETKLDSVCSVFGLGPAEKDVLLLMYLYNTDSMVERLYDELAKCLDVRSFGLVARSTRLLSVMTGFSRSNVGKALIETSPLVKAGLLTDSREIARELVEYLEGNVSTPITGKYFSEFTGHAVPLEYHVIEKKVIDAITTVVSHKISGAGINILLYGKPGTGKTEFSRALGRKLGKKVYEVKNITEDTYNEKNRSMLRYRALFACQRMVDEATSLVVVDEADGMLNTRDFFNSANTIEKGQINKILDETKNVIIWITNRFEGIDESTMRRFDYTVGFEKLTFYQRKSVWQLGLEKYGLTGMFSSEEIEAFTTNYEISAGSIDIAIRNAARIKAAGKEKAVIAPVMENIMKAHVKVIDEGMSPVDIKKPNAPSYSLDGLNIKADMQATLKLLDRFNAVWNGPVEAMAIKNMNLLLYGPPGTGKTEFAKFVARSINRRLIVKRASDLQSHYLGMTEKYIHAAFNEAEKDKAILFIDEADSFLGSRENAQRSWEITEVNEMLSNMETFRGMCICATNFKRIVDIAAIRRFNIKLEFDYLTPEGAMVFYNLFLATLPQSPLSDKDGAKICTLPGLTPGDFKVVHQKFLLFEKSEVTHEKLIESLGQELTARDSKSGKTIGFTNG